MSNGKTIKKSEVSKKSAPSNNSEETTTSSSSTVSVYRYKDIVFNCVEVSELNKDGSQPLAYVNYLNPTTQASTKLLMQSGKIKLTSHGIPSLDKKDSKTNFYPDDSKREFIKIPLDPGQAACLELREHLEKADEWAGSDEMRKKLFGKRADKYQFQTSIKTPQKIDKNDDEEDEEDDKLKKGKDNKPAKVYPVIDYVKMKFNVVKGKNMTKLKKIEGNKKNLVKAETITEIASEITFLSEVKFIFYYNKIWANKTPSPGAPKIMYGIGFKIMAIEYTPGTSRGLNADNIDFLSEEENDDDEESGAKSKNKSTKPVTKPVTKPMTKTVTKTVNPAPKLDSDDDNEEDNEEKDEEKEENDDEEESESKKPNPKKGKEEDDTSKKVKAKTAKKVQEDDEEEEDDDTSKKVKSKTTKKVQDDDEEEEEEISVKKVSSKKGSEKKGLKKQSKDEDEEAEEAEEEVEEEIKGKKKSSKGKTSSKTK